MTTDQLDLVQSTVSEIAELESHERHRQSRAERVAMMVTAWTGTVPFLFLNAIWFVVWIGLNVPGSPVEFDGFPFSFLTMVVSLEAIFLSIFVLISENAESRASDRRARLDMQVNVIAEREVSKVLAMVAALHEHFGLEPGEDAELKEMELPTPLGHIAETVEAADSTGARPSDS